MSWLYADQGNSRIKWRLSRGDQTVAGVALTPDELAETLRSAGAWPTGVALASVASDAGLQRWEKAFSGCRFWYAQVRKTLQGLKVAYSRPDTLGVDRWLAMAGGWQCYRGQAYAVVDAGTAITFDVVAADGEHLGGWIAPGVRLLTQAVESGMARVQSAAPNLAAGLGRNTQACVAAGLGVQLAGMIREAEAYLAERRIRRLLLTGGDALLLKGACRGNVECIHVPDLVLDGLEWVHRVEMPE
ncbi:MAG: type III pantothenate kinase [Gammaproteobacteria bacterium]|nr:MAG: type III pantothenate kinase [Gammaproteobacteria bacterium]